MSHITQEHVRELAERSGFLFQDVGYAPTFHTMPLEYSEKCFQRLCNAAIQHYIDSAALAKPEPEDWSPSDKPMTSQRALYFIERFKKEEKLLGPNEQAAVDYVINMLKTTTAQPEPVEPKLSMFKLLAITIAYEQGVGKGKQGTEFNPYTEGTTEREAWRLGYQEGQGMAAKGGAL